MSVRRGLPSARRRLRLAPILATLLLAVTAPASPARAQGSATAAGRSAGHGGAGPTGAAATVAPPLRIARRGHARVIAGDTTRGGVAYPAAALEALGARVQAVPGGVRVILFRDTLAFADFSPFFHVGKRIVQLPFAVYREGGAVYWPRAFFINWLPSRFDRRLTFRNGVLVRAGARAADVARAADAKAPPPIAAPAAAPAAVAGATDGTAADTAVAGSAPTAATGARVAAAAADSTASATATSAGSRTHGAAGAPGSARPAPARPAAAGDSAGATSRNAHRLVVLDPGHGGRDPGRIGPDGVKEKTVTLQIAKRLAALLRQRGYHVRLTRTRDTLIALADRPRMANRWKQHYPEALFMSIHANAYTGHAEGFETYFLSDARTEDERRVAAMENSAESYETHPTPGPAQDDISLILNNLKNNFYVHASDDLAEDVQKSLGHVEPGPNRGVKQAGFRVLVGALMPAVLVETAFISDRSEERLLATGKFQEKLAHALANAIDAFFNSHEHLWRTAGR